MAELKATPLKDLHLELGARMVAFAGYNMPVQYPHGIKFEHEHTRNGAGLFDISHMGQVYVTGDNMAGFMETLVPADITGLGINRQRYTVLTNEHGGVIDDLMITNTGEYLLLVVNASCRCKDLAWLHAAAGKDIEIIDRPELALLALQGPAAHDVLLQFCDAPTELSFLQAGRYSIEGVECFIHRSGYTGEDGFEISMPAGQAETVALLMLNHEAVKPCGLGARDSLRLEAGLCLYGHELNEDISPVEAGLGWTISSRYREDADSARFPGAPSILVQLQGGAPYTRTGIQPQGRQPVREGTLLLNKAGEEIGRVTSGGFGPTVNRPIAMGLVRTELAGPGSELQAIVRERSLPVQTCKLPFVKHLYKRKPGD